MLARYRHAYMLASLVLLLFVYPFVRNDGPGRALMDAAIVITLVTSIFACSATRRQAWVGLSLTVLMEAVSIYQFGSDARLVALAYPALGVVVFGYVIVLMLQKIFVTTRNIDADAICGALSVYLLLGILWVFLFTLLEIQEPGSFAFGGEGVAPSVERFIGFSYVTLTTLGYGNVVPTNPRADALCAAEALVGQIYLTVMLARLVALQVASSRDRHAP